MKVGDKVLYVPAECYAVHLNPDDRPEIGVVKGEYPWEFAIKDRNQLVTIESGALRNKMRYMLENKLTLDKAGLYMVRPKAKWPAVVTELNEDGTVNLDVDAPRKCVTLHEVNVKVDPKGETPGSCHAVVKAGLDLGTKPDQTVTPTTKTHK